MKWIPLSERKPDIPYTSNILFAKEGYIIGSYSVLQPKDATHWMYLEPPKPEKPKDPIQQAVQYICENHNKIIDDWCQAYLAELYQKGIDIKPGCFTLVEQQDLVLENGKIGKRYWFELKQEKSKDPHWEKLESSFNEWNWLSHGKVSTNEVLENMYYYLKDKHDRNE